ncbi:biopolymer transporter ExbD [Paracoccus sp. 1_MG-2023]|uniref:ExbD/TolR family protein n=1 Tax=unclassified Paracoccus (in: a-proteobacteria) TaxID=2688777 RepID=UPI001C0800EF|nr:MULTISPECIES: biopolymer transporter ExbD [unclassified Paracoccus (in: a-proteobacteria)]MBU2956238.1 biopolymer transporter ExbD [Paracoccus sp. C2R09]MDO6667915.1 biopolymer transporter ExbD [Paracoccus sp. 1_MG-2023]
MSHSPEDTAIDLGPRRHPRRMSLTPMIDVVFLLLIFFMLASRFGMDAVLPIAGGSEGVASEWQGAPRLVDIRPGGLALNGTPVDPADLPAALADIMPDPAAGVILRAQDDAALQRLVDVMDLLNGAGLTNLILIE